jgi:hypothetical protein
VRDIDFLADRSMKRDARVPLHAVKQAQDDTVVVNITAEHIAGNAS